LACGLRRLRAARSRPRLPIHALKAQKWVIPDSSRAGFRRARRGSRPGGTAKRPAPVPRGGGVNSRTGRRGPRVACLQTIYPAAILFMQEPAQAACPGMRPLTGPGFAGTGRRRGWATAMVIPFLCERDTARVCFCPAGRERSHDQLPQRPDQFAFSDKDDRFTRTDLVDGPAWHRPVRRRQAQGSPFDKVYAAVGVTLPSGIQHPPVDASRSGHLGDHHPHPASMSPCTP
jgi:hypothetical protein